MILATHAVTGAVLSTLVPSNPVLGFVIGFGSHFILDSIPHWDYSLKSLEKDEKNPLNNDLVIGKDFFFDLCKIAFDGVFGLALAFIFVTIFKHYSITTMLCGSIGAMVPDALQFLYFKCRKEPLVTLQKFHTWIHTKFRLKKRPVEGILSQSMVVILFILLLR